MATKWSDGGGSAASGGCDGDRKPVSMFSGDFPEGLRVLLVDDDPTCLMILEKQLRHFKYEVTKCDRAEKALSLLRENKNRFDIVISDVQMPDIDGFQFLLQVGSEMDLPIIVMSADDSVKSVIQGMKNGACDYLIKPVRTEALQMIYKHVAKKVLEQMTASNVEENAENSSSVTQTSLRELNKRKTLEGDENDNDEKDDNDHISTSKKPRVVWSMELHQQFVTAVNQLGLDKAVPKKILEIMNVPWLTRENVASHLQKYRMYLKKMSDHGADMNRSFISHQEASFCTISSSLNGNGSMLSTTAYQGTAGYSRQAANPGVTMAMYPRAGPGQPQHLSSSVAQMHLLNGIPITGIEPKQLIGMNASEQVYASVQSRSHIVTPLLSPTGQPVLSTGICPAVSVRNGFPGNGIVEQQLQQQTASFPDLPLSHDASEFSGNDFHLGNTEGSSIISNCDTEVMRDLMQSEDDDVLEDLLREKPDDSWDLQDIGLSPLPEPVVSICQELSSLPANGHIRNIDDMVHHFNEQVPLVSSARVKPEFPYLSNSFLDEQENVAPAANGFGFDGYCIGNKLLSF